MGNHAMTLPKYAKLKPLAHRFQLIKCKFPANIRMFVGGSIYGDLTSRFVDELFLTKEQFEKEKASRMDDWTEQSVYPYTNAIKNLTHAQIVRKPQYRGRPTYNLAPRRSMNYGGTGSSATSRYRAKLKGDSTLKEVTEESGSAGGTSLNISGANTAGSSLRSSAVKFNAKE